MADRIVLDGELSLNIPLDGEVGLMSLIEVGISEIHFNSDYTITFVMTDGRKQSVRYIVWEGRINGIPILL